MEKIDIEELAKKLWNPSPGPAFVLLVEKLNELIDRENAREILDKTEGV